MRIKILEEDEKCRVKRIERGDGGWLSHPNQSIPDALLPVVEIIPKDKKVKPDIKVINFSSQFWCNLTIDEREKLLELVEYSGIKAEDYLRQCFSMYPKNPRGK